LIFNFSTDVIVHTSKFVKGAASWAGLADDGLAEIAFVGRSNVGKSSLINMLAGRKAMARTSNTPGKTQEFNYYLINDSFYFLDLPGLGYAKVSKRQRDKWEQLISRYLDTRETLRLVIHLVDSRHDATRHDQAIMQFMKGSPVPYLIVMSKADKPSKNKLQTSHRRLIALLGELGLEVPVVMASVKDKNGRDEIWQWIQDVAI